MDTFQTTLEEVVDPVEIERSRRRRERYLRNDRVLRDHIPEVYHDHRGKVIVVAGEELHVCDTAEQAWAWARAHHPEDDGLLLRTIPQEKGWRIYATRG